MDKRFYWIKLMTDFFEMPSIDYLLSLENGCRYIVLYQMLCLLTANKKGYLASDLNGVIIPFDCSKISRDTKYFSIDTIKVALDLFEKLGLIYFSEKDNCFIIKDFELLVGSVSKGAIDKKKYRAKKKKVALSLSSVPDNLEELQKIARVPWIKDFEE